MHHAFVLSVGLLWASPAFAAEDPVSNNLLGIFAILVGAVIAFFGGARAQQQGARLGWEPDSTNVAMAKGLYIFMGIAVSVMGLLMVVGVIAPPPR